MYGSAVSAARQTKPRIPWHSIGWSGYQGQLLGEIFYMKDNIQIGLVGLGGRGYGVLEAELMRMTDITITGVCDLYEDRVKKAAV